MTANDIKKYIDKLNTKEETETIFLRKINESVQLARVWENEPKINDDFGITIPSYRFFFIKAPSGKYIGAVLDMNQDLHYFVLEEERKKGALTKALREAIIPYLFYDGRTKQRITIDRGIGDENYTNSKRVAIRLGFIPKNEEETIFELTQDDFDWSYENFEEENSEILPERIKELKRRVLLAYRNLLKVSDELLMAYDDDKDLRDIAAEVSYYNRKIGDLESENKEYEED